MNLTFWEVAEVLEAKNNWKQWENFTLTGIEFDSRKIQPKNLFVPLKGANDGHEFIENAKENGAGASLWSLDSQSMIEIPVILVEDTLVAMQKLASYYLKKINPNVIAITGSNGKTTTKDMVASVLAQRFHIYKTQGNYNNDIGLPYTILHMPETTEKLILEMGMDHVGEISYLSRLAKPEVAAITMIGEAHIENLGSRKEIAKAKMEIVDGLSSSGMLLVPAQELLLTSLLKEIDQKINTFGFSSADYQIEILEEDRKRTVFKMKGMSLDFTIPLPGKYNVSNAAIAICIGSYFKLSEKEIQQGLASVQLTKNRTQWLKTKNNIELLSDVYNANPTAMRLVLNSFRKMPTNGKRVAVLADMLELGNESKEMHEAISDCLDRNEISEVFLYGEEMAFLYQKLKERYPKKQLHHFYKEDKESFIIELKKNIFPEDIVVLKGSNGMGLQEVVTRLLN